jgi:hypothetical protein
MFGHERPHEGTQQKQANVSRARINWLPGDKPAQDKPYSMSHLESTPRQEVGQNSKNQPVNAEREKHGIGPSFSVLGLDYWVTARG